MPNYENENKQDIKTRLIDLYNEKQKTSYAGWIVLTCIGSVLFLESISVFPSFYWNYINNHLPTTVYLILCLILCIGLFFILYGAIMLRRINEKRTKIDKEIIELIIESL